MYLNVYAVPWDYVANKDAEREAAGNTTIFGEKVVYEKTTDIYFERP